MKKALVGIVIILGFTIFTLYSGIFAAGSYPYSETYKFKVSSDSLIAAINRFQARWPAYKVPISNFNDGKDNSTSTFYDAWIYYQKQNQIVHFVILDDYKSPGNSIIRLHAVNNGLTLENWKIVNYDLGRTENLRVKKQFEDEVLKKIKLVYDDDGNSAFVFWK